MTGIARELNRAKRLDPSAPALYCPADWGDRYALVFGYHTGPSLLVIVQPTGCGFVTNGDITGFTPPKVEDELARLLGHDDI